MLYILIFFPINEESQWKDSCVLFWPYLDLSCKSSDGFSLPIITLILDSPLLVLHSDLASHHIQLFKSLIWSGLVISHSRKYIIHAVYHSISSILTTSIFESGFKAALNLGWHVVIVGAPTTALGLPIRLPISKVAADRFFKLPKSFRSFLYHIYHCIHTYSM